MTSRRLQRVAEAIRETVSTTVLFELKDPRVQGVTVLSAEVTPDLRSAKVYISLMGDEKTQKLTMHGLNSARGFIQSRLADRLQTRNTPVLRFVVDTGIKESAVVSELLRQAALERGETDSLLPESLPGEHDDPEQDDLTDEIPEPESETDENVPPPLD